MTFELTKLPYPEHALSPYISEETVSLHHGKHHRGYIEKLNQKVAGTVDANKSLIGLIETSGGMLFNLAAQAWNHDFYWQSLHPEGGGDPDGELRRAITGSFGSIDLFKQSLTNAANGEFGSGWAWLVVDTDGQLDVLSSSDADNPLSRGLTPLLTIDVWEHAYYVDYRNERARYVEACIEHLLNWEHAHQAFLGWRQKAA